MGNFLYKEEDYYAKYLELEIHSNYVEKYLRKKLETLKSENEKLNDKLIINTKKHKQILNDYNKKKLNIISDLQQQIIIKTKEIIRLKKQIKTYNLYS